MKTEPVFTKPTLFCPIIYLYKFVLMSGSFQKNLMFFQPPVPLYKIGFTAFCFSPDEGNQLGIIHRYTCYSVYLLPYGKAKILTLCRQRHKWPIRKKKNQTYLKIKQENWKLYYIYIQYIQYVIAIFYFCHILVVFLYIEKLSN